MNNDLGQNAERILVSRSINKRVEIAGWLGVGLILLAYTLASFGRLDSQSTAYQILNGLGAIGVLIDAASKKDYQPAVLNVIWLVVAVVALVR